MQHESQEVALDRLLSIQWIADYRVAKTVEMYTNLMASPGDWRNLDQRVRGETLEHEKGCGTLLPAFTIYPHSARAKLSERLVYSSALLGNDADTRRPYDDCQPNHRLNYRGTGHR